MPFVQAVKPQRRAEHGHQRSPFAALLQLLCHFKGHQPAEAISSQKVRTGRLDFANFGQIVCRHLFHRRAIHPASVETLWFEPVKGLIVSHFARQPMQEKRTSGAAMDTEKRRTVAEGLDRDQRGIGRGFRRFRKFGGELLNGGGAE